MVQTTAEAVTTEERVSISLTDVIQEVLNHSGADKREQLVVLLHRARSCTVPPAQLKEQLSMLAGPDALRAAVSSLMSRSATRPTATASPASSAAPAAPLGGAGGAAIDEAGPKLFNSMIKEDFKISLIHAFHCRTPSCPVPRCASLFGKLERLHQHVGSCKVERCVLCRVWSFLKNYRDLDDMPPPRPHGSPTSTTSTVETAPPERAGLLYEQELLQSSQLLPRWHQGNVSWVTAREAIEHVYAITSGATPAADLDFPSFAGSCMPCAGAAASAPPPPPPPPPQPPQPSTVRVPRTSATVEGAKENSQKRVRVAGSGAAGGGRQKAARTAERAGYSAFQGVLQSPESLECLSFSDMLHNSMGDASSMNELGDDADAQSLFGEFRQLFAENAQGHDRAPPPELPPPESVGKSLQQPSGHPLKSISFGESLGRNISLTDINSSSLNEILGSRSFTDLGSALSFSQSRSNLKDANASDVSILSYLDRASSAFVQNEGLREIMCEFGASV